MQGQCNLKLRILSGVIIGILFLSGLLWLKPLFYFLMIIITVGMLNEWFNMYHKRPLLLVLGYIIILVPVACLIVLREIFNNKLILVAYFFMIWFTDIFAMFGGKYFKGPKLAPYISPNKTWSGLICGMGAAGSISLIITMIVPDLFFTCCSVISNVHPFLLGTTIALLGQLSDLLISYFKRKNNMKDSGDIIPGHGGVLDRFDSIILTAPLFLLLMII